MVKIFLTVALYSIIIYFSMILCGLIDLSFVGIIKSLFPIFFLNYEFISAYFLLLILAPIISKFIEKLDQQTHLKLIILTTIIWSIIPTIFIKTDMLANNIVWYSYLFLCASYIRNFPNKYTSDIKLDIKIMLISIISIIILFIIFDSLELTGIIIPNITFEIIRQNSFPILILSISMFLIFLNLPKYKSKWINTLSETTFGVYLIHDNPYIRILIWRGAFLDELYNNGVLLIIHAISTISIVIIFSFLMSYIYNLLFNRLLDTLAEKGANLLDNINNKIEKLINNDKNLNSIEK